MGAFARLRDAWMRTTSQGTKCRSSGPLGPIWSLSEDILLQVLSIPLRLVLECTCIYTRRHADSILLQNAVRGGLLVHVALPVYSFFCQAILIQCSRILLKNSMPASLCSGYLISLSHTRSRTDRLSAGGAAPHPPILRGPSPPRALPTPRASAGWSGTGTACSRSAWRSTRTAAPLP